MIHFRNSLLSDKFAAGPFLSYLQKFSDQEGQLCLRFWMQLEMLRLNFQSSNGGIFKKNDTQVLRYPLPFPFKKSHLFLWVIWTIIDLKHT